ncbi:MAG: hypothetical protein GC185_09060 [Alphaproteobacteria bacterium]|nr:hypothetical protein [Alphaproteobacteria bacterium]
MRSQFWAFVEACDETRTRREVKDLLAHNLRALGFESYALATHAPRCDLRSLCVLVCNWRPEAIEHLFALRFDGAPNPIFRHVEQTPAPLYWSAPGWRAGLECDQRLWLERFCTLAGPEGVTQAVRSNVACGSCTLVGEGPFDPEIVRAGMRIGNYAFHQVQFLQRPDISEADRLTTREHEFLYRAALHGERPSEVARRLGVKVSTVRTLRQKAYGRLDVTSPEEAVWRMIETGQLFRSGRTGKPRSR